MTRHRALAIGLLACRILAPAGSFAHEFSERDITIPCDVAEIAGTLTLPDPEHQAAAAQGHACVVIVGGTLS